MSIQDHNFKVKIADLLKDSSHTDTIQFTDKFSTLLPQTQEGIKALISFHGGDDKTIFFLIEEASVKFTALCDRCGKEVKKELSIEDIDGKWYIDLLPEDDDGSTIWIDSKDGIMDLEDFLVHSLLLTDDISTLCEDCQKKADNEDNELDDSNIGVSTIKRL